MVIYLFELVVIKVLTLLWLLINLIHYEINNYNVQ